MLYDVLYINITSIVYLIKNKKSLLIALYILNFRQLYKQIVSKATY